LPDAVRSFVARLARDVSECKWLDLEIVYEEVYPKLTASYFSKSLWPEAEAFGPDLTEDPLICILYKQLYYRHLFANGTPSFGDYIDSYTVYVDFFNFIFSKPSDFELPSQWLWDIVDEFIWQFQAFTQFRATLTPASHPDEIAELCERPDIWNVHNVLNAFYSVANISAINEQLIAKKNGASADEIAEIAGPIGSRPLFQVLGYFCLIGLLRTHAITGDYHLALRSLEHLGGSFNDPLFRPVNGCHITTFYYLGFTYMMLSRYADAIKTFSSVLMYIARLRGVFARQAAAAASAGTASNATALLKLGDKMYSLLAVCNALCPTKLEDALVVNLREKVMPDVLQVINSASSTTLSRGGADEVLAAFEKLFAYAAPKYVEPVAPDWEQMDADAA
ncbi:hypothetical protein CAUPRSCDRAFT_564, partial [Caulochytrium protostelioides]